MTDGKAEDWRIGNGGGIEVWRYGNGNGGTAAYGLLKNPADFSLKAYSLWFITAKDQLQTTNYKLPTINHKLVK